MFHYSLALVSSRSRMLFAALLAVALHLGLINFEFTTKQVLVPHVSLPSSISVTLNRTSMIEPPVPSETARTVKLFNEKQPETKIEPEKPFLKNKNQIKDKPVQQPVLPEKKIRQPVVEKVIHSPQKAETKVKYLMPDAAEAAKKKESAKQAEPQTAPEEEGASQPGTLQMAYPRYQLNTPPTYPRLARKRGQEGTVTLQILVNREGGIDKLEIETSSGFGLLDRSAVSAVKKWQFEPGRQGEERVAMWVRVPVIFKLNN